MEIKVPKTLKDRMWDYAESIPVCAECGPIRKPSRTPGEDRELRYECAHQVADRKQAEEATYQESRRADAVAAARATYEKSTPPESYKGLGLADVDARACSLAGRRAASRFVETWPERYERGEGLILSGDVGTGKTMIAAALAEGIIDRGVPVAFLTVAEMQRRLKSWDTAADFLEHCKTVRLLVLDDFGAERVTEWAASGLFDLIDARYQAKKPTVFTTNLGAKPLAEHYVRSLVHGRDKMPEVQAALTVERVLSRLRQRNATVVFEGADQRKPCDSAWLTEEGAA